MDTLIIDHYKNIADELNSMEYINLMDVSQKNRDMLLELYEDSLN